MKGLKGKRIIVAGGSTGIGAATAHRLADEGARLIVGSSNPVKLEASVERLIAAGATARAVRFDLADPAGGDTLVQACIDAYGGVDGLANIGADLSHPSITEAPDLLSSPDEYWERQFACNQMGYVRMIRAALPHLIAAGGGAIVNTSSASAYAGEPVRPSYAATKAAVDAVTRHVARRWGRDNIRCNSIAPGFVAVESARETMDEETIRKWSAGFPLRRPGEPEEVAALYAFLLSDDAAWITGQCWAINGGMAMR